MNRVATFVCGAAVGGAAWLGMLCLPQSVAGPGDIQRGLPSSDSLITSTVNVADKHQQMTVVDPIRRTLAVYHIDSLTGKVSLRSVRNIFWDLEMAAFNTEDPQPQEIRGMMQQR